MHPEVYIIIIPAFGIISLVFSQYNRVFLFGKRSMILAILSIALFGNIVWSHHMFTVGMEVETTTYFTIVTLIIAIPTGTKLYNWLSMVVINEQSMSFWYCNLFFVVIFLSGGVTGVILANNTIDQALHDTYYVVSHFHFILSIAAILGLISGVVLMNHLQDVISDSLLYTLLAGWLLTFLPQYFLGFNTIPRRIPDYTDFASSWNSLSSLGSLTSVLAVASRL